MPIHDGGLPEKWLLTSGGIYVPSTSISGGSHETGWEVPGDPDGRLSFRRITSYHCWSELGGVEVPSHFLLGAMRRLGWKPTLVKLAALAAEMANAGPFSSVVRRATTDALRNTPGVVHPLVGVGAQIVSSAPHPRPIANEKVIYYLMSLSLLEGDDSDRFPTDEGLALLMLIANDHVDGWKDSSGDASLSLAEKNLAQFARDSRFNAGDDPLGDFVRNATMFRQPQAGELSSDEAFSEFEAHAFPGGFTQYLEKFLGPITTMSRSWGIPRSGSDATLPIIEPASWYGETLIEPTEGSSFFERITLTVDDARAVCRQDRGPDGLPVAPTAWLRRPFLEIEPGKLLAVSPWLVREQLRLGVWGCGRNAVVDIYGKKRWQLWNSSFGYMFDQWCRERADVAASEEAFPGKIVLSRAVGTEDELEDVIIREGNVAILFSAKSRLMPEQDVKAAGQRKKVVRWYESMLFAEPEGSHRGGAVRLLQSKVDKIRAGETDLRKDGEIIPVVLTYERMGESPALYKWIQEKSKEYELLQADGVHGLTCMSAREYELILALAAQGIRISDVIRTRLGLDDGFISTEQAIERFAPAGRPLRMPDVEAKFEDLHRRSLLRLFGRGRLFEEEIDGGNSQTST